MYGIVSFDAIPSASTLMVWNSSGKNSNSKNGPKKRNKNYESKHAAILLYCSIVCKYNTSTHLDSDGLLWVGVDYKELVSKKSGFLNCSEKNHLLTALHLLLDLFAACLLIRWLMNEWKSKNAMHLLLFYYSFTLLSVFLEEWKQTLLEPFLLYVWGYSSRASD